LLSNSKKSEKLYSTEAYAREFLNIGPRHRQKFA